MKRHKTFLAYWKSLNIPKDKAVVILTKNELKTYLFNAFNAARQEE